MKTINIHQAKTQFSRLVEEASKGEPFVIAKAGKPMVKVTALSAPVGPEVKRLGLWPGRSQYRTTSTAWGKKKSSLSLRAENEVPTRYPPAAVGCGRTA
jgi:prevent-host-death family protein